MLLSVIAQHVLKDYMIFYSTFPIITPYKERQRERVGGLNQVHAFLNCMSLPQIMASKTCSSNGRCWGICYDSNREGRCVLKIGFYLSFMKLLEKGNVIEGCVGLFYVVKTGKVNAAFGLLYSLYMLLLLNSIVRCLQTHNAL